MRLLVNVVIILGSFIIASILSFYGTDIAFWCYVKRKHVGESYDVLTYNQYRRLRTQYEYFMEIYSYYTKDELEDELRIVNSLLQTMDVLSISSFYLGIVLAVYQLYAAKVVALGAVTGMYFAAGRFIQFLSVQQQAIERNIQIKKNESTW